VAGIRKADGNLTKTDQETAEALCNYFAQVFTQEDAWIHEKELKLDNVTYTGCSNGGSGIEGIEKFET